MATVGGIDARDKEILDRDRLPWLETVDDDYDQGPSALRLILLVLLGLAIVGAAIAAYYYYQQNRAPAGTGQLIAAPAGDYKVKPDISGGLNISGEGESAIKTSDGGGAGDAAIDLSAVPETPIAGTKAAAPTAAAKTASNTAVAAVPRSGGKLKAAATGPQLVPLTGYFGGALVQLGSFPSEAVANAAWDKSSKRFAYLAPLGKSVQKAEVNGNTVYRLRVNAGSAGAATTLCGKLKVAGEACFVAKD